MDLYAKLADHENHESMIRVNVNEIARRFGRPVVAFPGRSDGMVVDILVAWAGQAINMPTKQLEDAYDEIRKKYTDEGLQRTVTVAHGSGGILASGLLGRLVLWVTDLERLSMIEMFTFGSMGKTCHNPVSARKRVFCHLEHFDNG
jgi:hypothetical protein